MEKIGKVVEDGFNTNPGKESPKHVHLFNCDSTYNLDSVEKLFCKIKYDIRRKLNFDIELPIAKNYFPLSKMSEMCETTIPKLQMGFAVFVVHAHESRLSINEDNAGIGYAKIYRALLKATDKNVLIVIGGDDQYSNTNEEERYAISRWARRKISSQFQEEFMDGRKSFIFSWNKNHRTIHEEALLHYFDPSKKGQKFEYQPKHQSEVSSRGKESEAENKNQKQFVKGNADKRDKTPSNNEQRPDVVGDNKGMSEEGTQPHRPVDCDLSHDVEQEEFEVIELPDANKTEVESAANNTGVQPEVETLLVKTRLRYGLLSDRDDDNMVRNKQWTPPDKLLSSISERFKDVAEADLEIYRVEDTGVIHVKITDTTKKSLIYAMIEVVSNVITWIIDNTRKIIQWERGSEAIVAGQSEEGFAIVNIQKQH